MKFIKKLVCAIGILSLVFTAFPTGAHAAGRQISQGVGYVTASALRLRSSPSTTAPTLAFATTDEIVVILEASGSWYKVIYNLQVGYMHASYLETAKVKNAELGYGEVNYNSVNMRSGPSTSHSILGKSKQGDMAYIIGINQGWYKVIWNNTICYIRSDYLNLTEYPYENRASSKSPLFFRRGKTTGTAVSVSTLNNSNNSLASSKAQKIISTAKQYLGVPYVWGGTSPSGFDCSGLVYYVFQQHGIHLNRTAATQYQHGTYVSKSNLRPGDLVFFQNTYKAGISHVGIYVGNGQFLHASSSQGVTISALSNSYWSSHYYGARRIL